MSFATDLRERFSELQEHFPGYDEILIQALIGIVAEEHILWYSQPGRAKSMVARAIFEIFDGDSKVFATQLTKDMMPEAVFGNVIPNELMKDGREIYNLDNGIADCTFAYLDEFFDASDYVLRAMLNVLNEREFLAKDMGTVHAPLHTAICTTNYMRLREATQAVVDRLMCKAVVGNVTELTDLMRAGDTYLGYAGKRPPMSKLSYGDLKVMTDLVQSPDGIDLSHGMQMLHVILIQEFEKRRYEAAVAKWHTEHPDAAEEPQVDEIHVSEITTRTKVKLHDFSRAAAALNDRNQVVPEDMRAIGYGLYVVGDGSGDDVIWHTLCDQYLRFNGEELNSLEKLGEIADKVGQIKAERGKVSDLALKLGGKLSEASSLDIRDMIDRIKGVKHPVLDTARRQLDDVISCLDQAPQLSTYDLLKGWS